MFVLQKEPRWTWPVRFSVPIDGGTYEEREFKATFRLVGDERRRELAPDGYPTLALLREAVVSLHDIVDEAGVALAHTPELLDALLSIPFIQLGIVRSYSDALAGFPVTKAERGN